MKFIVITGVSTGIGYNAAEWLMKNGYHVFGSVRKQDDAERLQPELGERFTPLLFDVSDPDAISMAVEIVLNKIDTQGLTALINNAGISLPGPLQHQPVNQIRAVFETNLFGVLNVTQAFLPLLGATLPQPHPPGRIINISSVSGKLTLPFVGAYASSKHALESISDALRRELMIYGIPVSVIEPGNIRTPIWDKAETFNTAPYNDTDYMDVILPFKKTAIEEGKKGLPPDRVGRVILKAVTSKKPKPRYVIPHSLILGWYLPRLLSDRWLDRIIALKVGLKRKR